MEKIMLDKQDKEKKSMVMGKTVECVQKVTSGRKIASHTVPQTLEREFIPF